MSSPPWQIQCANPTCLHPANPGGQHFCDRCQAPLVYRYLWAMGDGVEQVPPDTLVGGRYRVKQAQIWLDTQPGTVPDTPDVLPDRILPYLHLYPHRLHIPDLYGVCATDEDKFVLLLDNVPIDETGQLFSPLESVWTTVPAARQVYWLWQLFQLWKPLNEQGVATSLVIPENLRVEGWRVRLQELISDWQEPEIPPTQAAAITQPVPTELPPTLPPQILEPAQPATAVRQQVTLSDLAAAWMPLVESAQKSIQSALQALVQQMQTTEEPESELKAIEQSLNQLLLEQVAQLPLTIDIAGATTTGPQRAHNEDACYPNSQDPTQRRTEAEDFLLPYVGIICDGIGGHEGGEVASQRALEDLKNLVRHLLNELLSQTDLLLPETVSQQLESLVRVVNNVIAKQNDEQGRELRQRMGTTLVMAIQLPQQVTTTKGLQNAHELYLVTVGDSRAYWLTPHYCHRLTVDDDVATREVRMGRSLYQEALERPDGGALTQAIGTRDADTLHPTVQRFVVEENGLLLLCSDGLSDNDRVEQFWQLPTRELFKGKLSLDEMVQTWIRLANEQNGHDNTSVVAMRFQVGETIHLLQPDPDPQATTQPPEPSSAEELTEASKALLYDEENPEAPAEPFPVEAPIPVASTSPAKSPSKGWIGFAIAGIVVLAAAIASLIWWNSSNTSSSPPEVNPPGENQSP